MPFADDQRISPRKRAIYRRSAALRTLAIRDVESSLMGQLAPPPEPTSIQLELAW